MPHNKMKLTSTRSKIATYVAMIRPKALEKIVNKQYDDSLAFVDWYVLKIEYT